MRVPIYQFDKNSQRYFFKLGLDHNYGRCFELICWVSPNQTSNLSLYYSFEMIDVCQINTISMADAINALKSALKLTKYEEFYVSYMNYIHVSAARCLDHMLDTYSFYKAREKAASTIQKYWRPLYENPECAICQRRLKREFEELEKMTFVKIQKNSLKS